MEQRIRSNVCGVACMYVYLCVCVVSRYLNCFYLLLATLSFLPRGLSQRGLFH